MLVSSVKPAKAEPKKKLDACDYAGIWSDEEYMDVDELVKGIHDARHFKDRTEREGLQEHQRHPNRKLDS